MRKKTKYSKSAQAAATCTLDDDDFDQMLAEVTAADPQLSVDDPTKTANTSSSSGSSSTGDGSSTSLPNATILEEAIIAACPNGSVAQLRRLERQGVRVRTGEPLFCSVYVGASL
jgi:hypothetical protein